MIVATATKLRGEMPAASFPSSFATFTPFILVLTILTLTHQGGAQSLRLDDVFAASPPPAASAMTVKDLKENPVRAKELLTASQQQLDARKFEDVLTSTELLTAWLPQDSDDYATALWFRARAYEGLGDKDKTLSVADLYIRAFPKGANRGWFLLRVARELAAQSKLNDAMVLWKTIAQEKYLLSPDEALEGAELLNRCGDGADARTILQTSIDENAKSLLPPKDADRFNALFLESLLASDDPAVELPAAPLDVSNSKHASLAFRRALLLEIRGKSDEAAEQFAALQKNEQLLGGPERQLLEDRIARKGSIIWPPPAAATPAAGATSGAPVKSTTTR